MQQLQLWVLCTKWCQSFNSSCSAVRLSTSYIQVTPQNKRAELGLISSPQWRKAIKALMWGTQTTRAASIKYHKEHWMDGSKQNSSTLFIYQRGCSLLFLLWLKMYLKKPFLFLHTPHLVQFYLCIGFADSIPEYPDNIPIFSPGHPSLLPLLLFSLFPPLRLISRSWLSCTTVLPHFLFWGITVFIVIIRW